MDQPSRLAGLRRSARQHLHAAARRLHVHVPAEHAERERVARARGAGREVDVRLVVEIVGRSQRRPVVDRHRHALAPQNRRAIASPNRRRRPPPADPTGLVFSSVNMSAKVRCAEYDAL